MDCDAIGFCEDNWLDSICVAQDRPGALALSLNHKVTDDEAGFFSDYVVPQQVNACLKFLKGWRGVTVCKVAQFCWLYFLLCCMDLHLIDKVTKAQGAACTGGSDQKLSLASLKQNKKSSSAPKVHIINGRTKKISHRGPGLRLTIG